MKVCVYSGAKKIVEKSGVGRAMNHQKKILTESGHAVVEHMDSETDVIHLNTVFPDSVLTAWIGKLRGKSIVYYGHSTKEDFRYSFKGSNMLAPVFGTWIKFCYSLGDIILTPTEYSRKLLKSYGIKKSIVAISNGIDITNYCANVAKRKEFRQKYQLAEEAKVILSVGHYIERKGILEFLEMAKQMPEVTFMWFGYTNPKLIPSKIQKAIASAPENVRFPGYVTSEELKCAYQGCDLFCFLSHEETEGIVVLEALACEIPVLVRDIPVYEDWLVHEVNVYKARETEQFVSTADRLLKGALPNLTLQGRKVAEERAFSRIGEKLEEIYKRI